MLILGGLAMLTPIEIEKITFKKAIRGYNTEEVDSFMTELKDSYGRIYKEYLAAKDKITILTEAVRQYKAMEETLQNTLLVAQSAADDVKKNAYSKADVIVREAETKAAEIINNAGQEVTKVKCEYEELKQNVDVFRARIVALLTSQLDLIKDFSSNDNTEEKINTNSENISEEKSFSEENIDTLDEIDIPQMLEKIERITMELPKIDIDEDNNVTSVS